MLERRALAWVVLGLLGGAVGGLLAGLLRAPHDQRPVDAAR